jgi:hypothetical protein
MPIKNLTEEVRLPRLGRIRLGTKRPDGKPQREDHFVLPRDHALYGQLVARFGEEPRELRVVIPLEDEEKWAEQYYRAYSQTRGLICKGDGETATQMQDVKTGELVNRDTGTIVMEEVPCAGRDCEHYRTKTCKETLNLRFMLPDIPGLGVWEIDTHSVNNILNINSSAKIIRSAFGRVSMIPLILSFDPAMVRSPRDGKLHTMSLLNLRTNVTLAELAAATREQAGRLALEVPDLERQWEAETERTIEALYGEATPPKDQAAG